MNIHIITGPNGMCRCGEDGKTCSEILNHETARLTSELIALQAHVEELRAFAKEVGEFIANTYDNADWFNKAKKHLASQPNLPLIEEVREVLTMARIHVCSLTCQSVKRTGTEWKHSSDCRAVQQLLTRLNPRK